MPKPLGVNKSVTITYPSNDLAGKAKVIRYISLKRVSGG